jgi:hypothetical protein
MSSIAFEGQPQRQPRPTETPEDRRVLTALRDLHGRATMGDVLARTGLVQSEAEASLRRLLEARSGHLEVGEAGTLVYQFDPRLVHRDHEPFWSRFKRGAWSAFKTAFKVWTLLMLAVYLVVFVALLIAAVFAGNRDNDGGGWGGGEGRGSRGHRGHGHGFGNFMFWYWLWSPGWGWNRPYYGERWEQQAGREAKVPLYKKVFAFVFGPDRPKPTQAQKDRSVIRLIRSRRGVLTAADLVQHLGIRQHEAEAELARLMAAYEGDVRVTDDGTIVYVFPGMMVSAHGRVADSPPDPAWRRLEPPSPVTGNAKGTDVAIAAVNAFNLAAAATAPLFIFPRLGFGGPVAWVGLVWVPVVFSSMFFGIPLLRSLAVRRENAKRSQRNLRKALLPSVFRASLVGDGAQPVTVGDATPEIAKAVGKVDPRTVDAELVRLSAEWETRISVRDDGQAEYRFDGLRSEFTAADEVRKELALDDQKVGEIVYSSGDTTAEADRRDAREFERSLTGGLEQYLSPTSRPAYMDDFELVATDEEILARKKSSLKR